MPRRADIPDGIEKSGAQPSRKLTSSSRKRRRAPHRVVREACLKTFILSRGQAFVDAGFVDVVTVKL
jgi:hypothetical protein